MTETKTVLFDPGYAQHTTILSIGTEYIYASINQFKNFGQKKMKFKMFYPQIERMVNNNIGFCLGSLLWAVYIKTLGDIKIEGNPCLGGTYDKNEVVEEVDFSIEFFEKLKKDAKYYLGTDYKINPLHIDILNLYKEFLTLNCGFVNTNSTNDVQLPAKIKTPAKEELEKINNKIKEVIESGNLLDLTEVFGLIYEG
ncbi:hypothetical protein HDR58_11160 [bacterium]|nr:hypothetical protein [bacterium]